MTLRMVYNKDDEEIEYTLATEPIEAAYWTTHRLKKSEIKIITRCDRSTAAKLRQEILDDILSREFNPSKKSEAATDTLQKRRKSPKPQYAKARQTKQKARR